MKIAHLLIFWWLSWVEPPTPLHYLDNEKGGEGRRGGERQEKGRGGERTTPNKRLPCSQCEKLDLQVAAR